MMRLKEITYKILFYTRIVRSLLNRTVNILAFLASLFTLCLFVYEFGFQESPEVRLGILHLYKIMLQVFLGLALLRIAIDPKGFRKEKGFWFELIILFCLMLTVFLNTVPPEKATGLPERFQLLMNYLLLGLISVIDFSKQIVTTLQRNVKPEMMFAYSFLFIILTGTLLLMLPNAYRGELSFIDALFTSTSAVCVTGLTVVETSATYTPTGLIILAALIQIGGIGVMTFTSFFAMSFFCQVSFRDQISLKNILNENSLSDIFRTLIYILLATFITESLGAYMIYLQIEEVPADQIPHKLFFSIFHAISAYCNAGFSTLPQNLYDPSVRHLYGLQGWIGLLVILGGLGFPILFNFGKLIPYHLRSFINRLKGFPILYERRVHIISLTSRIVFRATLILVVGGTLLFWVLENDNTLKGLSLTGKLATSFMSAVTPRTAGFNSVEMGSLLPPTVFLIMILMWIGASPMSTGGGIKTTTFALALKNIFSVIRDKERVEMGRRQIPRETVNRAHAIIFLSLLWIGTATLLLLITNPQASAIQAAFEIISAYSTVGLSLNLTPALNGAGKLILVLTMFVGRVGLVTLLLGIAKQQLTQPYTYPDERIIL